MDDFVQSTEGTNISIISQEIFQHDPEKRVKNLKVSFAYTIRITCPCDLYTLTSHFYIVKLGFTGVYIFVLFLLHTIDCECSLEPPHCGGSNVYQQSMFWSKNKENITFLHRKITILQP